MQTTFRKSPATTKQLIKGWSSFAFCLFMAVFAIMFLIGSTARIVNSQEVSNLKAFAVSLPVTVVCGLAVATLLVWANSLYDASFN